MKKNTYQILAICFLVFVSFGSYTFLNAIEVAPEVSVEQVVEEDLTKKEMLIQLPDVSMVQKAVEIGEKLFNSY